jgi:hypothetical protein
MPGQHLRLIGQGPELFPDPSEEQLVIAIWKVRTPDATREKDIPADEEGGAAQSETDAVRRMTRDMKQVESEAAKVDRVEPLETMIDRVGIDLTGDAHHALETL